MNAAVRRGLIAENPMRRLERGERPRVERKEQRILQADEIGKLLHHAPPRYRLLLSTALSTGLREMELLGLTWDDVDFGANVVRVRAQLSRVTGERKPLKTGAAKRDVLLTASIARELKAHRLASPFFGEADSCSARLQVGRWAGRTSSAAGCTRRSRTRSSASPARGFMTCDTRFARS